MIQLAGLIASLAVMISGLVVWQRARDNALVRSYAAQAIVAAFKLSEVQVEKFGARLRGEEKAAVVALSYGFLPPKVKAIIGEDAFVILAGGLYDELVVLYDQAGDGLAVAFAEWERQA
jgi:hypothetical protein